jgi:hypothetical protein
MWRFALLLLFADAAQAVELRQIEAKVGTDGLLAAPVAVMNASAEPISCTAELAHWYSQEVGEAAPGATAHIALWFEPATGTYVLLNAKQERMPVESLWCGLAGRAYATRSVIALERKVGAAMKPTSIVCSGGGVRLICAR